MNWRTKETPGIGRLVVFVDVMMHIGRGSVDADFDGTYVVEALSGYFSRRVPMSWIKGWMYVEEFKWPSE